jgi:hypothetical protein
MAAAAAVLAYGHGCYQGFRRKYERMQFWEWLAGSVASRRSSLLLILGRGLCSSTSQLNLSRF